MRKFIVTVGIIAVLAGAGYLAKVWTNFRVQARTSKLNEDVENLFSALQKYKEHVGAYPIVCGRSAAPTLHVSRVIAWT